MNSVTLMSTVSRIQSPRLGSRAVFGTTAMVPPPAKVAPVPPSANVDGRIILKNQTLAKPLKIRGHLEATNIIAPNRVKVSGSAILTDVQLNGLNNKVNGQLEATRLTCDQSLEVNGQVNILSSQFANGLTLNGNGHINKSTIQKGLSGVIQRLTLNATDVGQVTMEAEPYSPGSHGEIILHEPEANRFLILKGGSQVSKVIFEPSDNPRPGECIVFVEEGAPRPEVVNGKIRSMAYLTASS